MHETWHRRANGVGALDRPDPALSPARARRTSSPTCSAAASSTQDHGSTQTGLINGVYQDLLGRAPDERRAVGGAGHVHQRRDRTSDLCAGDGELAHVPGPLVSLDYQQLLLRAPLPSEQDAGQGTPQRRFQVAADTRRGAHRVDRRDRRSTTRTPAGRIRGSWRTRSPRLLMRRRPARPRSRSSSTLPQPHDATWQGAGGGGACRAAPSTGPTSSMVVYAKFLTYSVCAVAASRSVGRQQFPQERARRVVRARHLRRRGAHGLSVVRRSSCSSGAGSRASIRTRCRATAPSDAVLRARDLSSTLVRGWTSISWRSSRCAGRSPDCVTQRPTRR